MSSRILAIGILICAACTGLPAWGQQPTPYAAVEIDRFGVENGVTFPLDHQITLVEEIIHETKRAFKSVEIVREGEPLPNRKTVLRIIGNVSKFKAGSRAKRYLIGFGAGSMVLKAQVKFVDAASGQLLLDREVKGLTWIGILGGSERAGEGLAKKIVALEPGGV